MFKVQQEFYNVLKDGSTLGLTKQDIRKLMKRRNFGNREINILFRGKFTPFKASEPLMQKRLRDKIWIETKDIKKSGITKGIALEIGPGPGYLGLEWLKNTQGTTHLGDRLQ